MKNDISDMEQMIFGYLEFAKGDGDEKVQRIEFNTIMDRVHETAIRLGLNVKSNFTQTESKILLFKPHAMERAFNNFVSNAAHYATEVEITTQIKEDIIMIVFDDNGPGISENVRANVLNPFVRGEESRNQKTGGVGLGLTIANDIIIGHGGDLLLSHSDNLGGLRVIVSIPA
jgi:two-component system osmolarity sensor histidine kinase EnvZ